MDSKQRPKETARYNKYLIPCAASAKGQAAVGQQHGEPTSPALSTTNDTHLGVPNAAGFETPTRRFQTPSTASLSATKRNDSFRHPPRATGVVTMETPNTNSALLSPVSSHGGPYHFSMGGRSQQPSAAMVQATSSKKEQCVAIREYVKSQQPPHFSDTTTASAATATQLDQTAGSGNGVATLSRVAFIPTSSHAYQHKPNIGSKGAKSEHKHHLGHTGRDADDGGVGSPLVTDTTSLLSRGNVSASVATGGKEPKGGYGSTAAVSDSPASPKLPGLYRRVVSFQMLDNLMNFKSPTTTGPNASLTHTPFPLSPTTNRGPMMATAAATSAPNQRDADKDKIVAAATEMSKRAGKENSGGAFSLSMVFGSPTTTKGKSTAASSVVGSERSGSTSRRNSPGRLFREADEMSQAERKKKQTEEMRKYADKVAANASIFSPKFSATHGGGTVSLPSVPKAQLTQVLGTAGAVRHKGTNVFSDDLPPPRLVAHENMPVAPKGAIYRSRSLEDLLAAFDEDKARKQKKETKPDAKKQQQRTNAKEKADNDDNDVEEEPASPLYELKRYGSVTMGTINRQLYPNRSVFGEDLLSEDALRTNASFTALSTDQTKRFGSTIRKRRLITPETSLRLSTLTPPTGTIFEPRYPASPLKPKHIIKEIHLPTDEIDTVGKVPMIVVEEVDSAEDVEEGIVLEEDEIDDDEYEVISYYDALGDLLPFAIPATANYFLTLLLSVLPLSVVGREHGQASFNAASVGFFLISAVVWYPVQGMLFAVDTLCSHEFGRDKLSDGMGLILQRGLLVAWTALAIILAPLYLNLEAILSFFYEPRTAKLAAEFLVYCPLYLFSVTTFTAFMKFVSNQMLPSIPLVATAAGVAITPIIQKSLSKWGLRYVMLGMGIATFFQLMVVVSLTFSIQRTRKTFGSIRLFEALCWPDMKTFLKIAIPSSVFVAAEAGAFDATILLAATVGDEVGSAWSSLMNTEFLLVSLANGLSVASCAKVGSAVGSNQPVNARTYAVAALLGAVGWSIFVNVPVILFYFDHMMAFFGASAEQIGGVKYIFLFTQLFESLEYTCQGIFSGANMNKVGAPLLVGSMWGVGVLSASVLGLGLIPKGLRLASKIGLSFPIWNTKATFSSIIASTAAFFHLSTSHGQHHASQSSSADLQPLQSSTGGPVSSSFYFHWFDSLLSFIESLEGLWGISIGTTLGLAVLCPLLLNALRRFDWDSLALQGQIEAGNEDEDGTSTEEADDEEGEEQAQEKEEQENEQVETQG